MHLVLRSPERRTAARAVALVVVVVAGVYVAYANLGRQTEYVDEFTYAGAGWQYVHGALTGNLQHPPTAKYLYGLAQLVLGEGVGAARVVAATASFGTGVVLFAWLRRPIGFWGALLAAGWWWCTPRAAAATWADVASGAGVRIDRLALLEPLMVFFAVAAVAVAWHAVTRESDDDHGRWRAAGWWALSGALFALSVTSKVSTAVVFLAIAALPALHRRWRAYAIGAPVAAVSFLVVFAAVYLPVGGVRAIRFMLAFQTAHDVNGHTTTLLGRQYQFAPWWANAARVVEGVGWPTVVVLVLGLLAAVLVRPDPLVGVLGTALAALVVFYCTAQVALPYYYDAWMPWTIALAATGLVRAARLRPPWTTVVALVAVAATVLPAVVVVRTVAESRETGFARLSAALDHRGVPSDDRILVAGSPRAAFSHWTGRRASTDAAARGDFGVVVAGADERFPLRPALRRLLADEPGRFTTFRVDFLRVWVVRGDAAVRVRDGRTALVDER